MDPVEPLDPLPGNPGTPLFLPDWLARRAALTPERTALLWRGEARTFAELDAAATRMAQGLRALGVLPGDRVALLLGNGPPFVELLHGAGRAGAVLVPLNLRLRPPELAWQVADAAPRLLLFEEGTASLAASLRPELPGLAMAPVEERDGWAGGSAGGEPPSPGLPSGFRVDLAAPHTLLYTSGTGGRPKGAILTYGNLWWSAVGSLLHQGLHHDDRWLACLPLFHVGGLAILVRALLAGVPVILHERFDPVAANRAIDQQGATLVSVVATMLVRMLEARGDTPYPPSLRCLLVGGGPVPAALVEACARRGIPVSPTYGLTEAASQVATLAPGEAGRKPGSAGKPLFPTEVRVVRDGQVLPPGEAGEILVRGPTVSPGYWQRPEETARAFQGGWLHTGDVGYLDEEGYLYLLDRRDDLIVSGGENVYPAEVEAVLAAHPAVAEAGVTGVADPLWGQVPVAAVQLKPGAAVAAPELAAFCRERLAAFKVPKEIRFVGELPRNAAGKLLRRELRALWERGPVEGGA